MTQEALKLALEALEGFYEYGYDRQECFEHITAIKEALAQTQEPVAFWNFNSGFSHCMIDQLNEAAKKNPAPLYTTPPQRTWVGLEGEEIRNLWEEATKPDRSTMTMVTSFAKSIEAKLKLKNGYAEEKNT